MRVGIFLAPVRETPGHIALAEGLGFASAWCDDSPRLRAAVGPVVAVAFHAFAEQPWRLDGLDPALREQAAADVEEVSAALPPERRHQELHRGHLVELALPQDEPVVTAAHVPAELRRLAEALL